MQKEEGPKGPLVGLLMLVLTDPLDATTFGAVNSTKSPMEDAQGSGWHIGGGHASRDTKLNALHISTFKMAKSPLFHTEKD